MKIRLGLLQILNSALLNFDYLNTMQVISITQLRANIKKYLDDICKSSDTIIVTRQTEEAVVMISLYEYNSLIEKGHSLSENSVFYF
jgi:PHD/YefM family antitoxin component YafN of YafNO toxin-antitoxin module